jgi:hypothetical protein
MYCIGSDINIEINLFTLLIENLRFFYEIDLDSQLNLFKHDSRKILDAGIGTSSARLRRWDCRRCGDEAPVVKQHGSTGQEDLRVAARDAVAGAR